MSDSTLMPLRGKTWDPARDSAAARNRTYISTAQMKAELETDLRRISRDEDCERIHVIEARQRRQEREKHHPIRDLPDEPQPDDPPLRPVKSIKVAKPPKVEKPKKPGKPDGYVTIGELCEYWKILPMHARACLRGSGLDKPDYGWAFDPKDTKRIKKICGVR